MTASSGFTGSALSFSVVGDGVSVDPATGALSIHTDALRAGVEIVVTATNAAGAAASRFRLTVAAAEVAPDPIPDPDVQPALVAPPRLVGAPLVGAEIRVDPGLWDGTPAPALALEWRRDGAPIPGATGPTLVPGPDADGAALSCRVTASNAAGATVAETEALRIVRPAPEAVGTLADLTLDLWAAPATLSAQAAFEGAGLTYALDAAPPGVAIDAGAGLVTIPAAMPLVAAPVIVRAANSGGSAAQGFAVSVRGARLDFEDAAALAEMGFVAPSAPAWSFEPAGFARLVPALASRAHGDWRGAEGDGRYRCLVRWGAPATPSPDLRACLSARIRLNGANFHGVRADVFQTAEGLRRLQLRQYVGSTVATTVLATATVAWDWDAWHWLELELAGATIRARLYPEAAPAPAWQVEGVTTQTAAGAFGPGGLSGPGESPVIDLRRIERRPPADHDPVIPAAPLDTDWDIAQSTERT